MVEKGRTRNAFFCKLIKPTHVVSSLTQRMHYLIPHKRSIRERNQRATFSLIGITVVQQLVEYWPYRKEPDAQMINFCIKPMSKWQNIRLVKKLI